MRLAFIVVSLAIIGVESLGYRKRIKKIIPSNQENYVYRHHQTSNLAQQHRAAEERAEDDFIRRKIFRRKKVYSKPPQLSPTHNNDQEIQNGYIRRKLIKPVQMAFEPTKGTVPTIVTTTTTELPKVINEEGALNRSQDDPRFLSLFTIVSFKNDACVSGTGNNGTCYSSSDCSKLGGTASGSCASGFGVCCLFTQTCGGSTNNNCTYFQNNGYPSTYDSVGSCQLTVNKCASGVCQLRLDFDNFVLAQPETTDHQCQDDQFIVSGGSPIPAICGTNSGAHMYVDMGLATSNPITLTVVSSGNSFSRSFSIKVTQIDCTSLTKAGDGCLQYFTGVSGNVFSYNYNDGSGLQLSNTDYTICVRMERNFCGIQYTACPDTVNAPAMSFSITGQGTEGSNVGVGTDGCLTDWISIPCATNSNNPSAQSGTPSVCVDRICGMVFNSAASPGGSVSVPVSSYSKPFNIRVHTDSLEGSTTPAESSNRGFCLNYVQQPCNSATGK